MYVCIFIPETEIIFFLNFRQITYLVLAATMAILTIFVKVLVMKNLSEIHFSKCKCPGGYDGDPHNFCQSSGHGEHV